jgi:hypothetical protein
MKKNQQPSPCIHQPFSFFTRSIRSTLFLPTLFLVLHFSAKSQTTIDDFRTAAAYGKGVTLIPFKDMRVEATSVADEVQRRKSDMESFNLTTFTDQKMNLLKTIQAAKNNIEIQKKQKEEYVSKNPGAEVPKFYDEEITKQQRMIDDATRSIDELNQKLRAGVDGYDRLYQARGGLREYFDKAMKLLDEAKSNPNKYLGDRPAEDNKDKLEEYIENKKKLEEYIRIIAGDIEDEKKTHGEEETKNKETGRQYQELLNKNSL